jgi:hypothetical protein
MVKSEKPRLSSLQEVVLLRRVDPSLDAVGIVQKVKGIADKLEDGQEGSLRLDRRLSEDAVRLLGKIILSELGSYWLRTSSENGLTKITVIRVGQTKNR